MNAVDLYTAVHWTARISALSFAAALGTAAASPTWVRPSQALYLAFLGSHTIHFGFVVWLAQVTGGAKMFPGGRDVGEVGGLPAVFAIFACSSPLICRY